MSYHSPWDASFRAPLLDQITTKFLYSLLWSSIVGLTYQCKPSQVTVQYQNLNILPSIIFLYEIFGVLLLNNPMLS